MGHLELCFRPIARATASGRFFGNRSAADCSLPPRLAYVAYLLYLRKTLRYLDPSSVIPERVKAMLDTLAEGVLVLDRRERVVLANDAFGRLGRHGPRRQLAGLAADTLPWSKTKGIAGGTNSYSPGPETLRTGVGPARACRSP